LLHDSSFPRFSGSDCPQEVRAWLEMKAEYEPMLQKEKLVLFQKTLRPSAAVEPREKENLIALFICTPASSSCQQ